MINLENSFLVTHWRFELQTPWLKVKCSTSWASESYYGFGGWIQTNEMTESKSVALSLGYSEMCGGETGIRTLGTVTSSCFQDRCIRPLYHLSKYSMWRRRKDLNLRLNITSANSLANCPLKPTWVLLQKMVDPRRIELLT